MKADTLWQALERRYPAPAWCLFAEVRNGTGAARRVDRYADGIAMSMFPSRGLSVLGFEIKVDRRDWMRELAQPDKAEAIAQFCDEWWIVAPAGVVADEELPPTWGRLELKSDGKLHQRAARQELVPKPLDKLFVASLVRCAWRMTEAAEKRAPAQAALEQRYTEGYEAAKRTYERRAKDRAEEDLSLSNRAREFMKATGVDLGGWDSVGNIAEDFKLARLLRKQRQFLHDLRDGAEKLLRLRGPDAHD